MRLGARALVIGLLLVVGVIACGDGQDSPTAQAGGHNPPSYKEPVRLTEGDYMPPDFDWVAFGERGMRAVAEAEGEQPFEGDIAGFRLYTAASISADPSVERRSCRVETFVEVERLKIEYLPPGTSAFGPQYAGVCGDGSIPWLGREFSGAHGSFDVFYVAGEPAFEHDAPARLIRQSEINDRPALVIEPPLAEGFGRSWVAIQFTGGFVLIDSRDMPMEQTLKIAEGVKCDDC